MIMAREKGMAPTVKIGGMRAKTAISAANTAIRARSLAWKPLPASSATVPALAGVAVMGCPPVHAVATDPPATSPAKHVHDAPWDFAG